MATAEKQVPRAAVAAIARNEASYVAEWAAYHRVLGFDQVVVYDNESSDETRVVLERLAAEGVLTFFDWATTADGQAQKLAYSDATRRLRPGFDWVAFVDIDEFIVLPRHESIQAFLAEHDGLDAIAMNWKLFGTSGHERRPPGLVIESFTRCAEVEHSGNRAIKTLVRPGKLVKPNLHNHEFSEGVAYQTVAGEVIPAGVGRSERVTHDTIRVNHYFTKSREEWDRKVARGRATKPSGHPDKFRTEKHFDRHNRNEAAESEIQSFAARVSRYLSDRNLSDLLPRSSTDLGARSGDGASSSGE